MLDSVTSVFKPHGGHCCSHDHGNDHEHGHGHGHSHSDDHTKGHSHGHASSSHKHSDSIGSPSHGHSHGDSNHHSHSHSETTSCSSHGHSHGHSHSHGQATHKTDAHAHAHFEEEPICYDSSENNHFGNNLNLKAAVVHLIGDLLQSVGVIIAAIVIYIWPQWKIIDPICTYLFSIIVMFTTYNVFIECYTVLMEGTPIDIRVDYIREDILRIKGVAQIDDFHCWSISGGKNLLTAHIRLSDGDEEIEERNGAYHKSQVRRVYKEACEIIN